MVDEFLKHITEPMNVLDKHQKLIKKHYMTSTDFVGERRATPSAPACPIARKRLWAAFVATL